MAIRLFLAGAAKRIPRAGVRAAVPLLPKSTSVGAPLQGFSSAAKTAPQFILSAAKTAPHVSPIVSRSIITKAAALVSRGVTWTTKPYASRGLSTTANPLQVPAKPGGGRAMCCVVVLCSITAGIVTWVSWYSMLDVIYDEGEELPRSTLELPESIDWSTSPFFPTAVHPLYNALCGSCWAVVVVKSIEAVSAINTGLIQDLSIQQVIDCAAINGCRSGYISDGYSYVKEAGLTTEKDYPGHPSRLRSLYPGISLFYGKVWGYCQMKGKPIAVRIEGYQRVHPNELQLMIALQSSPVVVYANVNGYFRRYDHKGGVISIRDCPPRSEKPAASHCLLVVGYGTAEDGTKFWKLMNTWGSWWGKDGFCEFERCGHPDGVAGITEYSGFKPVLVKAVE